MTGGDKEKPAKKSRKAKPEAPALNVLYLEDNESLTKRMAPESVDLIFTDPPYVTEPIDEDGVTQWERAYVALHLIAWKTLKPSGFLITYAPQAHLFDIMEILKYGSSGNVAVNDTGGVLDYFWIIPSINGGATCKAHKWNALCLHKPILVFQKAPFKSPSKCFADVVRGKKQKSHHAWQQSVHDVLGIISRFMEPGQVLYDPFACTGTSLIAANLLGMQWIGAEIDPVAHATGIRELQQQPMDLFTFGGEKPEPPCCRETPSAAKDTSKPATIEVPEKSSKRRSRIDKPDSDIKTEPAYPAPEDITEPPALCLHFGPIRCNIHDLECDGIKDTRPGCYIAETVTNPEQLHKHLGTIVSTPPCKQEEKFEDQKNFKEWNVWLMRNCSDCSIEDCSTYKKNFALAQTWGKDFHNEPDCEKKTKIQTTGKNPEGLCEGCIWWATCDQTPDPLTCETNEAILFSKACRETWGGKNKLTKHDCAACAARLHCDWCPFPGKNETKQDPPVEKHFQCLTCGHHKARHTFHETCPRLGELLFKGGTKRAKDLMDETAGGHPCLFYISKDADRFGPCPEKNSMGTCMHGAYSCPHKTEEARAAVQCTYPIQPPHYAGDSPVVRKPAKKPKAKKKRFSITIEPVTKDAPILVKAGRKYLISCHGPGCGAAGSEVSKEEVIRSIIYDLTGWSKDSQICKVPITEMDVSLEDQTGEFTLKDFFEEYGRLKPIPKMTDIATKPVKKSRKKKEVPES